MLDGFELNKIAGGLLGALLFVMILGIAGETVFHETLPETPGYIIEVAEVAPEEEEAEPELPFDVVLASADVGDGERYVSRCSACHSFDEGGANKVGPALWGIVGRTKGSHDGANYSDTLLAMGAEGQVWDFAALDGFLLKPSDYAPGTSMAYNGISDIEDRANVVAYLNSLSASPLPLPDASAAVEAAAPEEAAPAEEAEATEEAAPAEEAPAATEESEASEEAPATTE